jgi:hypothetical protein
VKKEDASPSIQKLTLFFVPRATKIEIPIAAGARSKRQQKRGEDEQQQNWICFNPPAGVLIFEGLILNKGYGSALLMLKKMP